MVAGPKPDDDPSLADDQAEFKKLNDELFGDGTGVHTGRQGHGLCRPEPGRRLRRACR